MSTHRIGVAVSLLVVAAPPPRALAQEESPGEPMAVTAESLSVPGALQAYVDRQLAAQGVCVLPPGRIALTETLVFRREMGARLVGSGHADVALAEPKLGWNWPDVDRTTRLVGQMSPDQPVVRLEGVATCSLEHLTVSHARGGDCIHYPANGWGGPTRTTLDRVAMTDGRVGFKAGDSSGDHNAADVAFRGCVFRRLTEAGLEVNNHQGMNYAFSDLTYWAYVPVAIHLKAGGNVYVHGCASVATPCLLRIDSGGVNNATSVVSGFKFDVAHDKPCVVVDASRARGRVLVDVTGVGMPSPSRHPHEGHVLFRLPENWRRTGSAIRVGQVAAPRGAVLEPRHVAPEG